VLHREPGRNHRGRKGGDASKFVVTYTAVAEFAGCSRQKNAMAKRIRDAMARGAIQKGPYSMAPVSGFAKMRPVTPAHRNPRSVPNPPIKRWKSCCAPARVLVSACSFT